MGRWKYRICYKTIKNPIVLDTKLYNSRSEAKEEAKKTMEENPCYIGYEILLA